MSLDLGNFIEEDLNTRVLAVYDWLGNHPLEGVIDRIVAYSSVSVFYDPTRIVHRSAVSGWLMEAWQSTEAGKSTEAGRSTEAGKSTEAGQSSGAGPHPDDGPGIRTASREVQIPVCYEGEYAPDLEAVAREKGMSPREVIDIHSSVTYRIYMIGFLPGFPYMGKIDARLETPRKTSPVPVIAGGVGIAGVQTGVYPLNSPGGWQIIGRTPLRLFDRNTEPPILLRTGDRVRFNPVSPAEFRSFSLL
jgi:inhibitor of KinA